MAGTEVTSSVAIKEVPPGSSLRPGDTGIIVSLIGSGSYGKAFLCQVGSRGVVAKCASDADQRQLIRDEYDILKKLESAEGHVPAALGFGAVTVGSKVDDALIEEMCEGYALKDVVEQRMRSGELDVSAPTVASIGISIASAVRAVGRKGVRHGDLSYTNVLLQQTGDGFWHCSIIDFGQAVEARRTVQTENRLGTVAFSAPEMFRGARYARFKDLPSADLFSVGALMFYMRTWGCFEDREPGSYFEQFTDPTGRTAEPNAAGGRPFDLERSLKNLGADVSKEDRELGRLIAGLTETNPKLRPQADECIARLSRITGMRPESVELRQRLEVARRVARKASATTVSAIRLLGKGTKTVLMALFAITLAIDAFWFVYFQIKAREDYEIDTDSAEWRMIDDAYRQGNRDTYDPNTPGLREHEPAFWLGQIDGSRYGTMTAHYGSDKYIMSDGFEYQTGEMAYTDTHEILVVPFRDSWTEVGEPIRWGDNLLQTTVAAHGGWEQLSYRYITPRPDREMKAIQEYIDAEVRYAVESGSISRGGIDYTYVASSHHAEDLEGTGFKAVTCFSKRSDSCILEAQASFYPDHDGEVLDSVGFDTLLGDLLDGIQVRSSNLDGIPAASPYSDVTIVSEDGQWQALIKEDPDNKWYIRQGREWWHHYICLNTNIRYSDYIEYDFAPKTDADTWLSQKDFAGNVTIVDEGTIPADDGITVHWSLADVGHEDGYRNLRTCVEIGNSVLTIQCPIGGTQNPSDVVKYLLLDTIEISRNQSPLVNVVEEISSEW